MKEQRISRGESPHRRGLISLFLVLIALAGLTVVYIGGHGPTPPPQPALAQSAPLQTDSRADPQAVVPLPQATPTRVQIPSIKVDAPLIGLSLDPDQHLAPPPEEDTNLAGWYQHGTPPGSVGTAIIAGHVDNDRGPGVFYNLGVLKRGDRVEVERTDGNAAVFTIYAVEAFDAKHFPDQRVYGPSTRAELRVITCGAGFDTKTHHYRGNVVAFAHLTATQHTS